MKTNPEYEVNEYSDCCYAPIIYGDICTQCKEHCEPIGEGQERNEVDVLIYKLGADGLAMLYGIM